MDLIQRRRELMAIIHMIDTNILRGLHLTYGKSGTGIYATSHGQLATYSAIGQACLTYIDVRHLRGQTITLNHRPTGNSGGFAFYREQDDSKTSFVLGIPNSGVVTQGEWTITIPDNNEINYMRFTANPNYIDNVRIDLVL